MTLVLGPESGLDLSDQQIESADSYAKEADELAVMFDVTADLDPEILADAMKLAYGEQTARGLVALRKQWLEGEVDSDRDLKSVIKSIFAWNEPATPDLVDGKKLNPEKVDEVAAASAFLQDTLK